MQDSTELYIHFDLEEGKHFIPISQSITTEQSIERIIKNLSKNIFNESVKIEVFIEAEDEGGLVKTICISAIVGLGMYVFTEAADGILKGITGRSISEHSENITIVLRESVEDFLQKPSMDLVENGLGIEEYYEAYDAKNQFYSSAIANKDVIGIGFKHDHNFPIQQEQFPYKKIELRKEKIGTSSVDKFHDLIVISQINQEEEKDLMWHVKDKISEDKFALNIDDEDFYKIHFEKGLSIREFKVRVRYTISTDNNGKEKIEKKRVVMVYEYNGNTKLMTLPKDVVFDPAPYKLPDDYGEVENQTNLDI